MSIIIFIVGALLSSLVSVSIILDFTDTLFERTYKNKKLYRLVKCVFIVVLALFNALNNGWLNLITVMLFAVSITIKLYSGPMNKKVLYIMILVIGMIACESIGIVLLHFIYQSFQLEIASDTMRAFFDITITQIIVVLINNIIILQVIRRKKISELTKLQYFLTCIYAVFSVVNIYILSILLKDTSSESEIMFVLFTIVGIVIINTQFLKILEFASENNRLQYENNLFLEQSKMQYRYYDKLELQYRDSLSILHDVNRHIRAIEELYRHNECETALEYSRDITKIMNSFKLNEYTDNRVLNIILNDKYRLAEQNHIKFICKIEEVNLEFIDNIDLTTIFANLLDNAIEACLGITGDKTIIVQVGSFNNLVVINIKNTMNDYNRKINVNIKSSKKNHKGIGIPNVQKVIGKYNGDFNIQREDNMFVCSIVLSKQGRA